MSVYLQSTNDENLSICIDHGLWGAPENRLKGWCPGDRLIVYVNRALTALFTMTSEPFYDETQVWSDRLYPYRISIQLDRLVHPQHRISISQESIRNVLFKYHTSAYGTVIVLNARPLHDRAARLLLDYILNAPAWDEPADLTETPASHQDTTMPPEPPTDSPRIHYRMQHYLAELGSALGYSIWIPRGDRKRVERFGHVDNLFEILPNLPSIDDEQTRGTISNIDVIWFRKLLPSHVFEVEDTTNIQSGLVRMNDLLRSIPQLNLSMYICARDDRFQDVRNQVARPTFTSETLSLKHHCRFIAFESLSGFMDTKKDLLSVLKPEVVDKYLLVRLD